MDSDRIPTVRTPRFVLLGQSDRPPVTKGPFSDGSDNELDPPRHTN